TIETFDDVSSPALRTQSQIDAVHVAFTRKGTEASRDSLGQPPKVIYRGNFRRFLGRRLVDKHQIDIGTEVEFPAPELSHRQDGEQPERLWRNLPCPLQCGRRNFVCRGDQRLGKKG